MIDTSIIEEVTVLRQDLHKNPELSNQESQTAKVVSTFLKDAGFTVYDAFAHTSVLGVLKLGNSNKSILLRSELDALPIQEDTDLDLSSTKPGVMHACGHDGHIAMLLGASKVLATDQNFNGTLYVLFQHAEETLNGAKEVIESDFFSDLDVDAVYAMHNSPAVPKGKFSPLAGAYMASNSIFTITLSGGGGHPAYLVDGINPITHIADIISAVEGIKSKLVDQDSDFLLEITSVTDSVITAEKGSVVPSEITMYGEFRTFSSDTEQKITQLLNEIKNLVTQEKLKIEIEIGHKVPFLENSKPETELVEQVVIETFGSDAIFYDDQKIFASEDFAFFLQKYPGSYFGIGLGSEAGYLHTPNYTFDDTIIERGVAFWVKLAETALAK